MRGNSRRAGRLRSTIAQGCAMALLKREGDRFVAASRVFGFSNR
jgi:hypothetical protein